MAEKPSGLKPPSKIARAKPSGIKAPTAGSITSGAPSTAGASLSVGDRILVSGTKSGTIQFLGPTQFAPGDWAGVVLDKEEGKNDGSVVGVRYFQCEPQHGIFARPAKLSKLGENGNASRPSSAGSHRASSGSIAVKTTPLTTAALKAREGAKDVKSKTSVRSPASSIRSLKLGTPSRPSGLVTQDFEVGDKVIVNGTKIGFARFVGEADFAKGAWVGVELNSPQGKNDGSVLEKRYFTCEMLYGLFAPLHKVKKLVPSTPRTTTGKGLLKETTASLVKKRPTTGTGIKLPGSSAASISSISSFTGAKTRGLRSEVSSRYQRKTAPAGTSALQEALKEKQQHVESLMVERDLERTEVMQATQDAALMKKELEEVNIRYQESVVENETQLDALKELIEQSDLEKVALRRQLDEQKAKVEDLQFRFEEEAINKDDLESEMKGTRVRVRELEASLTIERNRSQTLQTKLENTRAAGVGDKSSLDSLYRERDAANALVQELKTKLNDSEITLQAQAKSSGDMDAFEDHISELMQELERMKINYEDDMKGFESSKLKLEEVTSEKNSLETLVTELKLSQGKVSEDRDSLQFIIDELKVSSEEHEKVFSQAQKQISQLKTDKVILEQEKEDILKASGDSSSNLITLNDRLREKNKVIEKLNTDVRSVRASVEEMKATNESLSFAKSALDAEVAILSTQIDETLKCKEDLEKRLTNAEANSKTLTNKLHETAAAHKDSFASFENLEREKGILESRVQDLMRNCQQLQETLHKAQHEWGETEQEKSKALSKAQSSVEELQKKLLEESTEKEYLSKKNEAMQNKVIELSEQHGNFKKTHEEMQTTLSRLQEQSGEETKNLLQQLQEQRNVNEKQRAMVTESTKHINEMLQDKMKLEEEKDKLTSSLNAAQESFDSLTESLKNAKSENKALTKQVEVFESENEMVKTEVVEVQQKLESAETESAERDHNLKDLTEKLAETLQKLEKCEADLIATNTSNTDLKFLLDTSISEKLAEVKTTTGQCEDLKKNAESENKSLSIQLEDAKEETKKKDEKAFQLLDEIQQLKDGCGKLEMDVKNLTAKCDKFSKANSQLQQEKDDTILKCNELAQELKTTKEFVEQTEKKLTEENTKVETLSEELANVKHELDTTLTSKVEQVSLVKQLETKIRDTETKKSTLQHKLGTPRRPPNTFQERQQETEVKILGLKKERDEMNIQTETLQTSSSASSVLEQQLKSLMHDKSRLQEERDSTELELHKLKEKLAENEEDDKNHRSEILILEADAANRKEEYSKLEEQYKSLIEIHDKIQAKLQKMEKSIPDIVEEREIVLKREFAKERHSLQQTIDITTSLVEETKKAADGHQQEVSLLKSENILIQSLKESLKLVETERDHLNMEIRSLKSSPISQSASTEDSGVGGDEELRGQIDFLNSVIVDQQTNIGELNDKISELESMLLEDGDINAAQIADEYEHEHKDHPRAAPRLFCDICDIFDAHDTDDCPTQSSMTYENTGLPPSVHNATIRGEEREYCENCEVFGHQTEDCTEEDEMY